MTTSLLRRLGLKLVILAVLALPEIAGAQYFNFGENGDVLAGFRKTGTHAGSYELVVDLGSVTNFLNLPAGVTTNITQFSTSQLTDAFSSGYGYLQWSVFSSFPSYTNWGTALGTFPAGTQWFTLPGTNVTTQTQPPVRATKQTQANQAGLMYGVGDGAYSISVYLAVTNADNNTLLVREPVSFSQNILTFYIGDINDSTIGDFGSSGVPLPYVVENKTPASFTAAQRSDFYQVCPYKSADPITGLTNKTSYFVGYFILNPNGSMTFTRASTNSLPTAGMSASATNGFTGLTVVFTNSSSGAITNWVWNFGNGTIITNTTGGNVTNTYSAAGSYTVSLAVYGPGGAGTNIMASYIVTSPTPKIGQTVLLSGGKLVMGGTNCPAGVQYRILTTTNVALAITNWTPVATNTFLANGTYAFTNNSTANSGAYYRLVSP